MFYPYVSKLAVKEAVKVLHSRWIGQGPKVAEFEEKFKKIISVPFAVAVNGISSSIRLSLAIAGVGPGDEVLTSPQTCTATNHPILEQFAKPVFTDIQYLTGNINPTDIEHRITEKTKAIICVHLGGYPCDLDEIHKIARRYNLVIIEDAQDAIGAKYKNRPIGSISRFTCFSFAASQQLTTVEGAMLSVLDKNDYEIALRRRWFGIDRIKRKPNIFGYYDFDITEIGYGYHMTDVQAVIGISHLEDLPNILKRRQEIAKIYRQELQEVSGVTLFENKTDRISSYQLFSIHVENRENFCKMMRSKNIDVSIVHIRNDIYNVFGGRRDDLPVLDKFTDTNISIPIHNKLTDEDINRIIKAIRSGW